MANRSCAFPADSRWVPTALGKVALAMPSPILNGLIAKDLIAQHDLTDNE
jgi:hypothetical protein